MAEKKLPFGGMKIEADEKLAAVCGVKVGALMVPSDMNKGIWGYIKANGLKVSKDGTKAAAEEKPKKAKK